MSSKKSGFQKTALVSALVPESPAIDFVPVVHCASLTDQTGKVRPIDGDVYGVANCDVGAVEQAKLDLVFKNGFETPD